MTDDAPGTIVSAMIKICVSQFYVPEVLTPWGLSVVWGLSVL
jgi:hypothetical protein